MTPQLQLPQQGPTQAEQLRVAALQFALGMPKSGGYKSGDELVDTACRLLQFITTGN